MSYSRRSFLKQASATITAASLFGHAPGPWLWAAKPADLLPEPDEALLRELALAAMEAARSAGASFADIRMSVGRRVMVSWSYAGEGRQVRRYPSIVLMNSYGIRALVDGGWGFATGSIMTRDAVAETARVAVAGAQMNRPRHRRRIELAPAPKVENGVWETEIEQDPFTVSLYEQRGLIEAVLNSIPDAVPKGVEVGEASMTLEWRKCTEVFASTDGSLVLQRLATALPGAGVQMIAPDESRDPESWNVVRRGNRASSSLRTIRRGPYGYEALGDADTLVADMREAAERAAALALASRNPITAEVGRYDLVFGAGAVSSLLLTTVVPALDLRRVLGYEANRAGTSFAAPLADMLGKYQVGSELLTVHGDRTQPKGAATVGWDREGVRPEAYTFVKDGVIMDYHTDRQTAMELTEWYRSRGEPVRAHGVARGIQSEPPVPQVPNLTMEPGKGATTVDDFIAGTKRGFYVEACGGRSDQQVLNTQFTAPHAYVRRITNGELGEYVKDFAFQFITPEFWKSVDGMGDDTTAVTRAVQTQRPQDHVDPFPLSTVRTVPMHAHDVNVLNTGRTG